MNLSLCCFQHADVTVVINLVASFKIIRLVKVIQTEFVLALSGYTRQTHMFPWLVVGCAEGI